jgi:hypothetical protein
MTTEIYSARTVRRAAEFDIKELQNLLGDLRAHAKEYASDQQAVLAQHEQYMPGITMDVEQRDRQRMGEWSKHWADHIETFLGGMPPLPQLEKEADDI